MRIKLFLFLFFLSSGWVIGQNNLSRPNIYIDCQMRCDRQFIKQEIQFVNYMQNRDEADVYILATRQRTGAGGDQIQLVFLGDGRFQGITDTLMYNTDPNITDAIYREELVKNLKRGLLPYVLESEIGKNLEYSIEVNGIQTEEEAEKDPWNYWVFNVGGNFSFDGEASFNSIDMSGRFSASRITEQSKFYYFTRYSYEESTFTLTDGETFTRLLRRFNNSFGYVHSINEHWSAGIRAEAGSSTFGNTDVDASFKPAVEYNIFPYTDAQTKRFSFLYSIGPEYKDYTELTIYDKLKETVLRHSLRVEFEQTQKWGNVELDMGVNQYLQNFKLWSMFLNPNLEWVIYKGLRLDMGGFISLVSDRINIAKSDLSDEDILLQIKQLDTNFTYFSYIGVNFRFGSKFNNFVNPRF